jgi:hypothetical protein
MGQWPVKGTDRTKRSFGTVFRAFFAFIVVGALKPWRLQVLCSW